ncbi:hypothetical protein GJW-30_1_02019 [Variibacter gotjawalensis]|uniref:Cysteine rich repeat protein n=2 Tax=Variibacter gotjawalensis TaxID=1333996 RepID=A0A0S3PUI9_9BRAD|nr:hypothetical protein EV661_4137 [Variibacter gotjawalensis]BAT59486.1 hypothetical protein GJW-30_1_02019 [Variibacter gotjawalensis]
MKTSIMTLLIVASFGLTSAAMAQGTSQQRSDCMGDAFSFCASSIPSVSKIEACLKRNVASLSPGCRAEFEPAGKTKLKRRHFRM